MDDKANDDNLAIGQIPPSGSQDVRASLLKMCSFTHHQPLKCDCTRSKVKWGEVWDHSEWIPFLHYTFLNHELLSLCLHSSQSEMCQTITCSCHLFSFLSESNQCEVSHRPALSFWLSNCPTTARIEPLHPVTLVFRESPVCAPSVR